MKFWLVKVVVLLNVCSFLHIPLFCFEDFRLQVAIFIYIYILPKLSDTQQQKHRYMILDWMILVVLNNIYHTFWGITSLSVYRYRYMLIHDYILHDFPGIKFTGGATQMSKPKGKAQSDWLKARFGTFRHKVE